MSTSDPESDLDTNKSEDLFDFDSTGTSPATTHEDELDVDAFLSAVGDLAEESDPDSSFGLGVSDDLRGTVVGSKPSEADETALRRGTTPAPAVALAPGTPLLVGLPWTVIAGGGLLVAVNAWLAFTLWSGQARSGDELERSRLELQRTAESVAAQIDRDANRIEATTNPTVSPVLDATTALAHVDRSLELGDFALARRQVYSLLSVVDRHPDQRRQDIEARSQFFLARIDRLEAQARRSSGERGGSVR